MNVAATLCRRIVTTRDPYASVRPARLERQLTRTRPLRAIDPVTRNRRPVITARILVRGAALEGGNGGGAIAGGGTATTWLRTTTGGDVAVCWLPAASTTTKVKVCGPSPTRRVSTLSDPAGSCGHGCASIESHVCVAPAITPPGSARTYCCLIPVASFALNVTGTTPDTTPPPTAARRAR